MKFIKKNKHSLGLLSLFLVLFLSCKEKHTETSEAITETTKPGVDQSLDSYWYQGKAEISSYELEQVRYGQKPNKSSWIILHNQERIKSLY